LSYNTVKVAIDFTGIADISTGSMSVQVYPNPTRGELRISPFPLQPPSGSPQRGESFPQRGKEEDSVNGELRIENVEIFDLMGIAHPPLRG
jgi:hypothetical protein